MDNYIKLAKEVKKRDNPVRLGVCVGEVIGYKPVTIRTNYNGVPMTFSNFFSIQGLMNDGTGATEGELYLKEYPYEIGDKFICMFAEDNQSIYILGRHEPINDLYIYLEEE